MNEQHFEFNENEEFLDEVLHLSVGAADTVIERKLQAFAALLSGFYICSDSYDDEGYLKMDLSTFRVFACCKGSEEHGSEILIVDLAKHDDWRLYNKNEFIRSEFVDAMEAFVGGVKVFHYWEGEKCRLDYDNANHLSLRSPNGSVLSPITRAMVESDEWIVEHPYLESSIRQPNPGEKPYVPTPKSSSKTRHPHKQVF